MCSGAPARKSFLLEGFIYSFNYHFLNIYHVPGIFLGSGDAAVKKTKPLSSIRWISGRRAFQLEGTADTKTLRQETAGEAGGGARRPG